ncbi:CapA family protein [Candidatus Saccharibacteria bacterium]|nr:CapA family protein [Candidatus Saccharibacteria bacterium]
MKGRSEFTVQGRRTSKTPLIIGLVVMAMLSGVLTFLFLNGQETRITISQPKKSAVIEKVYHGKAPNCPEKYCVSITVNGDLLFHPALWNNFRTGDEREFDFTPLFAAQSQYYAKSDIVVCDVETPIAKPGGPYAGYPIFNIPPQVLDAAKEVGYTACTTDTNHAWDQGVAGIERVIDKLDELGIKHTGTYKTEAESKEPLILNVEGGKLAIIGGTVSLNGMIADYDWRVDRLRDGDMAEHDYARMISLAKKAREQGADLVVAQLHSMQEYITYADGWQKTAAHRLIDSGEFDLVYFHGSHSVQPFELYNGVYIIYGLGNSQTVSAPQVRYVNNQGLTVRVQFASNDQREWRVAKVSYLPTLNKTGAKYAWCPLTADRPSGFCVSEVTDNQMYTRMENIMFSMGLNKDDPIIQPWLISEENLQN